MCGAICIYMCVLYVGALLVFLRFTFFFEDVKSSPFDRRSRFHRVWTWPAGTFDLSSHHFAWTGIQRVTMCMGQFR